MNGLISRVAKKLSVETGCSEEILTYSLSILTTTLVGYGVLLGIAYIFGWFKIALTITLTYSAFRALTGGVHGSTCLRCIVMTGMELSLLSLLVKMLHPYMLSIDVIIPVVLLITAIIFYLFAPAEVPEKPLSGYRQKLILKSLAFGLLIIWTLTSWYLAKTNNTLVLASAVGLIWQSFTITPVAFWMNPIFERFLEFLKL